MAEAVRTVVLGLLHAPGPERELAERLAEELPDALEARFPEVEWRVVSAEEPKLAPSAHADVDLVDIARRRMLGEDWDLVVCLTDMPLLVRRRPVTAHASMTHGVGLISVPALGPVGIESRLRDAVLRLVEGLLGDQLGSRRSTRRRLEDLAGSLGVAAVRERGTVSFVANVVRGNLRLLLGMVRANRPWRLVAGLSRALVAALGAGAFGIVSTGVWRVADGLGWVRLMALCLAAVAATCAAVIVAHDLWERAPAPAARERVALFNLATTATVVIGILTLFVALLAISTVCVGAVVAAAVLRDEYGHPVGAAEYLRIGLVLSMLATLGGGLGSALENDEAVREAAYGYRANDDA